MRGPLTIIPPPLLERWYYVSNSEEDYSSNSSTPRGGVGRLTFNSNGDVIDYEMIVENTSDNCGGGKTYWNTW